MKVSLQWAGELSGAKFIDDAPTVIKAIGEQLGAIDEIIDWGGRYKGIFVARVVSCIKHPNADKLSLCHIDDGGAVTNVERDEDGLIQVVCGAPNVTSDLLVVWIPPGATVPATVDTDPFVLEARELRGYKSNGMLASAHELGISDDHDGILVLEQTDEKQPIIPGQPLDEALPVNDIVVDIENKMFTHRPDCFGVLGVAREIAGIRGNSFISPDWYSQLELKQAENRLPVRVKIEAPDVVSRFMAVTIAGVSVTPSPTWMQLRLSQAGIRPINNIVDVTNYVMLLTGQPLHAYDYDKLAVASNDTPVLVARMGNDDELTLLNGKSISAKQDAIVIATDKTPLALAGVMGGADTEVDATTQNIVLEVASFDMYTIRKTSMRYGVFSDAVTRFTKGQSPLQNPAVISYATKLITDICGGEQASNFVDEKTGISDLATVTVTVDFINARLGSSFTIKEVTQLLSNVEFTVEVDNDSVVITPPFWRTDIAIPEDIVEEVGRLYGYDRLPKHLPVRSISPARVNSTIDFKNRLRDMLASAGANEVLTYSFVHGDLFNKTGQNPADAFQLSNAISPDLQHYRLSLTPSLLDKVNSNLRAGNDEFALFEINKTHTNKLLDDEKLPIEHSMLAFVFAASDKALHKPDGAPYYQARCYVDYLAKKFGVALQYQPAESSSNPALQPFDIQRSAIISDAHTGTIIGVVGEYKNAVMRSFKLPKCCAGFEIDVAKLEEIAPEVISYEALSKFPSITQDISFKVSPTTTYGQVQTVVSSTCSAIAAEHSYSIGISGLDIYRNNDDSSKHITFRLVFTHQDRTLKTEEITKVLNTIADAAQNTLQAERL